MTERGKEQSETAGLKEIRSTINQLELIQEQLDVSLRLCRRVLTPEGSGEKDQKKDAERPSLMKAEKFIADLLRLVMRLRADVANLQGSFGDKYSSTNAQSLLVLQEKIKDFYPWFTRLQKIDRAFIELEQELPPQLTVERAHGFIHQCDDASVLMSQLFEKWVL